MDHGKTASGTPITDDLVDELAAKAQVGYDVEQTPRRRLAQPASGSAGRRFRRQA